MEEVEELPHLGFMETENPKRAARRDESALDKHTDCINDEETFPHQLAREETQEESGKEIFYQAEDVMGTESVGYRDTVVAPSFIPESQTKSGEIESRLTEIEQISTTRKSYFRRHISRSTTGQSIGVQTIPDDEEIRHENRQSPRTRDNKQAEESIFDPSPDVYEDARETPIHRTDAPQQGKYKKQKRVRVKRSRGKNPKTITCPQDTRQKSGVQHGDSLDHRPSPPSRISSVDEEARHQQQRSWCGCLLTILFWLCVVLFILLLMSISVVIFLLFSHNHGLGIGPTLIYSDVEIIRNIVNPSLIYGTMVLRRHNQPS